MNESNIYTFGSNKNKFICLAISKDIRLRAGYALAIFGFNNTAQQMAIREAGGLPLVCLEEFLQSDNEFQRATAAFQVIVGCSLTVVYCGIVCKIYLCMAVLYKFRCTDMCM